MFIHFDKNRLHMQVIVGTMEEYKPTEKIKEMQERINALRSQVEKFQAEVVMPELEKLEKDIAEENTKFTGPKENAVK